MKQKKNIDSFFKERFNDFEQSPPPEVWETIKTQLQSKKEDRIIIPFWFKIGGVAALLALLFTLGNKRFFSPHFSPQVTQEETITPNDLDKNRIINSTDETVTSEEIENTTTKTSKDTQLVLENNNSVNKEPKEKRRNVNANERNGVPANNTVVAVSQKNNKVLKNTLFNDKLALNENDNKRINKKEIAIVTPTKTDTDNTKFENKKDDTKILDNDNLVTVSEKEEEDNKQSIFDAIKEESLEEDEVLKKETREKSWQVTPNFAPVYYSSIANGSSIDPMFADNPQKSDITFSYGVQVSYAISEKLSIRSGVNTLDLSYSTGDLDVGAGPVSVALKTIDYGGKQTVITVTDRGRLINPSPNDPLANVTPKSTTGNAELVQSINYFEVPLELQYKLLNKKIGINLIGGFSTLFLNTNEVYVRDGNYREQLGEATNLANTSFTTNIGLGLNYHFSKKFLVAIEPMFKYQINAYSDSSVSYKPYYLGVYTGLQFKF